MPNHITNILITTPEVADAFTRNHTDEEIAAHRTEHARIAAAYKERTGKEYTYPLDDMSGRFIDFGLVIPPPANMEVGGCNGTHAPGVVCWYEWQSSEWGTKWNAYSQDVEPVEGDLVRLRFDTAWAHPEPVVRALSEKFPDDKIEVVYADEDFGQNLGSYTIQGGEIIESNFPVEGSEEAYELAAQIKYGQTYAEVKAGWDEDEIESARRSIFCKRIETERGLESGGYTVIHEEGLEMPDDIKTQITTVEDAEKYWESA